MEVAACFLLWGLAPVLTKGISSLLPSKKRSMTVPEAQTICGVERHLDCIISDAEKKEIEDPLPEHEHGWFPSCYADAQLHYRLWRTTTETTTPRAVVIFMHGISTHSGKGCVLEDGRKLNSALQAEECRKHNIVMAAFDLYGHGYSEGTRCWIPERWENNRDDYVAFCKLIATEYPGVPIFLMGESYGCTLTLHVAQYFQENPNEEPASQINSIILTAPAIIGDVPSEPVFSLLVFLARYFPRWTPFFMPNPVSPSRIWRDPVVCAQRTHRKDRVVDGSGTPFRLGTGLQLVQAMEMVRTRVIPTLRIPVLTLHGTEDIAVPLKGSLLLHETAPLQAQKLIQLEGAYHDLLAEPGTGAENCMKEVLQWIDERSK